MTALAIIAIIFAIIGIVNLFKGRVVPAVIWIVLACLIGPGGISIFG